MQAEPIRVLLNGKKAGLEPLRQAIYQARDIAPVEVRVTWEGGDVERLVNEAVSDGVKRIVAAGGDGTVKEVCQALMQHPYQQRPDMAVLPLGTANDFATACQIPNDFKQALALAQTGAAHAVDCVKANEHYYLNVASGGFGAQVTSSTPVALKNFLGGGAYTLSGLVQALDFVPFEGELLLPDGSYNAHVVVAAVCNGKQAGGGQQLAPAAKINDGLLDVVALLHFPPEDLPVVIRELMEESEDGQYVKRTRCPWVEWRAKTLMPINLDGEPIQQKVVKFEVQAGALNVVLPESCPLL